MKNIVILIYLCLIILQTKAQSQAARIDLHKQHINTFNRQTTISTASEPVIHMDEQADAGIAWLTGLTFTNGTIEFDIKGKDLLQQSFVGIAFHASDEKTYDAIYFRPFNFKSDDAVRRSHGVQYISMPDYDWPILRETFPNKYEKAVEPAPEPNNWFHAKIVINGPNYSVYVNHNTQPVLKVKQLAKQSGNKIGFWVGNGSGGEWKNAVITSSP